MKFAILGGDERSARLALLLKEDGHEAFQADEFDPALSGADYIVLPPRSNCRPPRDSRVLDLMSSEAFAVKNAGLTAEGAVQLLLEDAGPLAGKSALILGYGRIARLLAPRLRAMGMDAVIAARSPLDRAWAAAMGIPALPLSGILPAADAIINTVPARLIANEELPSLAGSYLLELASPPYGFDMTAARECGLHCRLGAGLPGKLFPGRAAALMLETVYEMMEDDRVWKN